MWMPGSGVLRLVIDLYDLYRILFAPLPQGFASHLVFKVVPLVDRSPMVQQIFESRIGARATEHRSHVIKIVRQKLPSEIQRERLAETKLSLVRYLEIFLLVVDIARQFLLVVIVSLGMPVKFAGLPAQIGLML